MHLIIGRRGPELKSEILGATSTIKVVVGCWELFRCHKYAIWMVYALHSNLSKCAKVLLMLNVFVPFGDTL